MPRLSVIRAALAGLLTVGIAAGPVTAPASAAEEEDTDPLVVRLDTITPVLPRSGSVEITGTVTNTSDDTFTRVNLHAFSSQSPILDAPGLVASAAIDPTEYVGPRVTEPGTFATIDTLDPGETASFSDTVPVDLFEIPDAEGVYWIGVHALGDGAVPRDDVADGRARTFIPARPRGNASIETSVVVPLRARVWYAPDGRIAGGDRWARRLSPEGRLTTALDVAEAAGDIPSTWLVDPAVLVALVRLAQGNPPRSLAPDPTVPDQVPSTPEPTEGETGTDPATDPGATPDAAPDITPAVPDVGELDEEDAALAALASTWLDRYLGLVGTTTVLTLPFGDLDVAAAVRHDPERYTQAVERSAQVMSDLGLSSTPAVAPVSDVLSPEAISATRADSVILLGDNAFSVPPSTSGSVARMLGHKIVITSTGAESGGPGPTPAREPLAIRQRLLSEAALRLASGSKAAPVVVTLPQRWDGEQAATFFSDLEQPWLEAVPLPQVAAGSATGVPARTLAYTDADAERELGAPSFAAATRATDTSAVVEQVLTLETTIEAQVLDEVLVTLSEQQRKRRRVAERSADAVDDALREDLSEIRIEAPTSVTLSSDSGTLGATLVNGLDQPVTVSVQAVTDGELSITGNALRRLGPQTRSVVRFEAVAAQPGVHNVILQVTSEDGSPIGSVEQLPIRAARVSALIWFVMGAGALVLFGMIGYRLPGKIRQRRLEQAAARGAAGHPGAAA